MTEGYIYCFENDSMKGLLKIGMTTRAPDIRLKEANAPDTWKPPTPYKIVIAKKVKDVYKKEKTMHILLENYAERINKKREFFYVSKEEIIKFFELMDGEIWEDRQNKEVDEEMDEEMDEETEEIQAENEKKFGCRDMTKCFRNGQKIKHEIGIKQWIGYYDLSNNCIMFENKQYKTLSEFSREHYKTERKDRISNSNGWKECKCEVNGKWITTYNLEEI